MDNYLMVIKVVFKSSRENTAWFSNVYKDMDG